MPVMDRKFNEETSADYMANMFPYLKDRFDALKELRSFAHDMSLISNFGRRFARGGYLGRHVASIPMHVLWYWKDTYGFLPTQDKKLWRTWIKEHPEYRAS